MLFIEATVYIVGANAGDKTGESIGIDAEVAHGSCTDLPPGRK
jgi:hypothetical protein